MTEINKPALARIFTPPQIAVATLIGSPLPGFYLLSKNYAAAGEKKNAQFMLIVGFIVTALLIGIGFSLPEHSSHSFLPLASTIVVHQIAKMAQSRIISRHLLGGGQPASWWAAVGYGLLGLTFVIAILLGITFTQPDN